ncbi:enoyl-CoA hydratase/isomerase family protein [Bradyrhizobium sp. 177]|uniref:enoyl-CoA hydratase n=1 Tax=Bradyrhizobium sp. 177 TaxID=2782647 RepID=UPI001FFB3E14|nr:enoyl-CoA hydratase [Bradyrhizobium sp. 177]MCK1552531.1 enoyl-CoA hydratase/isomerase family protein [Bradyrhizobium sp. 177]
MTTLPETLVAPASDGYTPTIRIEIEDEIGWIIFANARRRNAVTLSMWRQIPFAFNGLQGDPRVKVIALRGEGEISFASGADVNEFGSKRSTPEQLVEYDQLVMTASATIMACTKPTVAVIRRWCIGGGLAIALCCDLRIASEDSRFAIPAAKLGLGYRYTGVKALVDIVGPATAREIFYTARQYPTGEARELGLINRAFPVADFEADARGYLKEIAQNAPLTIYAAGLSVNAALMDPSASALEAVDAAIRTCFESADYMEGCAAFAEKRRPIFRGN